MRGLVVGLLISLMISSVSIADSLQQYSIRLHTNAATVGIGRSVTINALVTDESGRPAVGVEVHPYRNGKRWGSHEFTDLTGRATFLITLPVKETVKISVVATPKKRGFDEKWIWTPRTFDSQNIYLFKTFDTADIKGARLWFSVDDRATVYLNGNLVKEFQGWNPVTPTDIKPESFLKGMNYLCVEAKNGTGPAAMLLRMDFDGNNLSSIVSDNSWSVYSTKPMDWPYVPHDSGEQAHIVSEMGQSIYSLDNWPDINFLRVRNTGLDMPQECSVSNTVTIKVLDRKLETFKCDEKKLIGMQWEEWFTPSNCNWSTAPAVPVMGFYSSYNPDVARQHLIWFIESGIDYILVDWSNNIWFSKSWKDIGKGTYELDATTTIMMDELVKMHNEGYQVPKMTFLIGVSHIRPEGPTAVNEQLQYIWEHYVSNPKFDGLWQYLDGKPLIQILDLGASYVREKLKLDDRFAIRFTGSQQDTQKQNELGFWTWMDRVPVPTPPAGKTESLTVNAGSFGLGGWKAADARGHRGGATLVEDWQLAMKYRPRFLAIHQFNEFAGQIEGQPAAPPNMYVDSYSVELSDDIEPTSLNTPAYRGDGGWGYLYLNMTKALVDLYKERIPISTVLAIASPLRKQVITTPQLDVTWRTVGVPAASCTIYVNNKRAASNIKDNHIVIDLTKYKPNKLRIRVRAEGTRTRYVLHHDRDAARLKIPVPAESYVDVEIKR